MNRNSYTLAIILMWLALPVTALKYWRAWDRLPARMAVHFNANWRPNGYTSREGSLLLGLGIMVAMLILFTVVGLLVRAMNPPASGPMLVVFYVVLGFLWFGNNSIVDWNLRQPASAPVKLQGPGR